MKILLISQARVSSSRLPAKVLKPLGRSTVLGVHLSRLKKSKLVTDFIVATVDEPGVEEIVGEAQRNGFGFFKGSLMDVLDRFYQASLIHHPDVVVRVTSDCPLIDVKLVDDLIEKFLMGNVDYASNCLEPNLPDGMDCEVFKFSALETAWRNAKLSSEREHVTPYIWKNLDIKGGNKFSGMAISYELNLSRLRLTLDQIEDYNFISQIVDGCGEESSLEEILIFLKEHPDLLSFNSKIMANEGYFRSLEKDKK